MGLRAGEQRQDDGGTPLLAPDPGMLDLSISRVGPGSGRAEKTQVFSS
jgi:hypothetical protein